MKDKRYTFGVENTFAAWTQAELCLFNDRIRRRIALPGTSGSCFTREYCPAAGKYDIIQPVNREFSFTVDKHEYTGADGWDLEKVDYAADQDGGCGAAVWLNSRDGLVGVRLVYLLYPNQDIVRKSLQITNRSEQTAALENITVENLSVDPYWVTTFSWLYTDYGRRKVIGPYHGTMQDALVILYHPDWCQGIAVGNEAPGVTKQTNFFCGKPEITAGLSTAEGSYPVRKWLEPRQGFEAPQIFTLVYNEQEDTSAVLNQKIPQFVREHMGIRLSALKEKPTFLYNTWVPFKKDIYEKMMYELIDAAAETGIKEFVIDDGWQDCYGDWGVDKEKFPNGLTPIVEYIKSKGMKPGIWVSIGTAAPDSRVYQEHPDWFVEDRHGNPISLIIEENDKYTACFSTGWREYICSVLKRLILNYGFDYLKLDFSVVASPYRFDTREAGCYSHGHAGHRDLQESYYNNYETMWEVFDLLHELKPELFIDCTFETMGGLQLIDYAMLKHAEGNWLSNFDGLSGHRTALQIRQMAWWRSPAMPPASLVIGNAELSDPQFESHIHALAGALPVMCGDPRKLSGAELGLYRSYTAWLGLMEKKHGVMTYRQDLKGFGEPAEGNWDGFQRINTSTRSGGIFGVFRHGSHERSRTVILSGLEPMDVYKVCTCKGKVITEAAGAELAASGFEIILDERYSSELFEVQKVDEL